MKSKAQPNPEPPEGNARYINPHTDFGFKKLFGMANKESMKDFLQTLLNVECDARSGEVRPKPESEQITITNLRYLDAEQLGRSADDRKAVYDLHCETPQGEKFIVEMQRAYQEFFKDRSVFYSTFPIQSQGKTGKWNYRLKAVYMVAILDFEFPEDEAAEDKYLYKVQLSDVETHKVFYDKLMFVYMELPKFKKTEAELVTNFDKWMYVLKNLGTLTSRPVALQERVFKRFFKLAEIAQLPEAEHREYQESLKNYWDYKSTINSAVNFAVKRAVKRVEAAKNKVIAEKDTALAEKDAALAAKDTALAAEKAEKAAALARIAELEKQLKNAK